MAAKTGTAQLNAAGEPEASHLWIIAFAPADAPKYAVAVMLKGTNEEISAGTGGRVGGPDRQGDARRRCSHRRRRTAAADHGPRQPDRTNPGGPTPERATDPATELPTDTTIGRRSTTEPTDERRDDDREPSIEVDNLGQRSSLDILHQDEVGEAEPVSNSGEATVINDRYEIHKRIGRGGMADVFLARDLLLDRQVAIKVLFPEFADRPQLRRALPPRGPSGRQPQPPQHRQRLRLGQVRRHLLHRHGVRAGPHAGRDPARPTSQLTAKQAAEIASEVAAALGFAHEAGLAHRDIKPANILIGTNGQVKVADFGIARAMNAATESNLTQVGSVMGTASYFSPEQAQGAQPDPRSDLYSLGIVMYEMVAGKPPFTGENPVSIAYKQVHDQPQPLNQIVADIPRPFEAIVAKLLAKDPKLRYSSAHALRDDLRRFRNGEQVQALVSAVAGSQARTTATPRPRRRPTTVTTSRSTPTRTVAARPGSPMRHHGHADDGPARTWPHYPPGASPAARYYEDGHSRTGWYALAAFIALIALAAGGVLLFQALNKDDAETRRDHARQLHQPAPRRGHRRAAGARTSRTRSIPEENAVVAEDFVHRTDPEAGTVVAAGTVIKLYYNPTPTSVRSPTSPDGPDRGGPQTSSARGIRSSSRRARRTSSTKGS